MPLVERQMADAFRRESEKLACMEPDRFQMYLGTSSLNERDPRAEMPTL
jgi:hypothetical protein